MVVNFPPCCFHFGGVSRSKPVFHNFSFEGAFVRGSERERHDLEAPAKLPKKKKARLSTFDSLLGVDHALESITGGGFTMWFPSAVALEPKEPILKRKTLVTVTDMGSDMAAGLSFLTYHMQMRLLSIYDPRHKLHRELQNAVQGASLAYSVGLFSDFVLTFMRGPWQEFKWFQVIQEETEEFLAMLDKGCGGCERLLLSLLPRIAREKNLPNMSISDARDLLAQCHFLRSRGGSGNTSRWDEFHSTYKTLKGEFALLLLILLSYGIKMNYFGADDSILCDLPLREVKRPQTEEPAAEGKTLQSLRQEKDRLYARCRNKLHATAMVLLNLDVVREAAIWFHCSLPVSNELNDLRRTVQGREAALLHFQAEARGEGFEVVTEIISKLTDSNVLREAGILLAEDVADNAFLQSITEDHAECQTQNALYQKIATTVLELLKFKLQNMGHSCFSYPLQFARLTAGNDEMAECISEMSLVGSERFLFKLFFVVVVMVSMREGPVVVIPLFVGCLVGC